MGAGHCCSTDTRCCGAKDENASAGSAPVGAEPIPSNELIGIENQNDKTLGFKADITSNAHNKAANDKAPQAGALHDVCPGGDSAAGGGGEADTQEYQYVTYEDGSTYIGQIAEGKRQGHGLWQSRTGQYEGQWKADSQHGRGRQTWSDGRVYDGQFHTGHFSGTGRMAWHTQKGMLIYDGQYKDDLKHGQGKFVWADGRTYDGEWQKGKRHGHGMYMNAKGECKTGYWAEDKFEKWDEGHEDKAAAPP